MFETETQSYYEVLDVKPDAGQNDIRQAYFRAKAAYGKDSAALYSLFDEQQTRLVLETIEQAYLVLSNPEKRKEYDKVHGFLSPNHHEIPTTVRQNDKPANTFSFGESKSTQRFGGNTNTGPDAAEQAANSVFGLNDAEKATTEKTAEDKRTNTANESFAPRELRHDDYSTPRTLDSTSSAGPMTQDYSSGVSAFSARENRLGIIRRIDLIKSYDKNPAIEDEIISEEQYHGDFFRRIREYKCITVDELSEFTKISKTYLNCIESEEFESLPAPAYLRGFVAQIAKALKLPHDKAASAYMTHYKNSVLK